MPWKLTIRSGPRVQRLRFGDLEDALEAIESHGRELTQSASQSPVDARLRRFEPVQRVAARLELAGPERMIPTVRAGVDFRGDGSTEAYLGRVKRTAVEQRKGETAYRALRRALIP